MYHACVLLENACNPIITDIKMSDDSPYNGHFKMSPDHPSSLSSLVILHLDSNSLRTRMAHKAGGVPRAAHRSYLVKFQIVLVFV